MRLVPLEIGRVDAQLVAITGAAGSTVLPVPAWLIEHTDGLILYDTGMHADLRHSADRIGELSRTFSPDLPDDEALAAELSVAVDEHGKMPDPVGYDREKDWLLLIEAVTSHGPVNPKRMKELKELLAATSAGFVFVTAFLDRATSHNTLRKN